MYVGRCVLYDFAFVILFIFLSIYVNDCFLPRTSRPAASIYSSRIDNNFSQWYCSRYALFRTSTNCQRVMEIASQIIFMSVIRLITNNHKQSKITFSYL